MIKAPCHGMLPLFSASWQEIKEQTVLEANEYATAIEICRTCPRRQSCATEGVRFGDRHTVRAGKRLWLPNERAELLALTEGETS